MKNIFRTERLNVAELDIEIEPFRHWLSGRVLNAGCGKRPLNLGEQAIHIDINANFAVNYNLLGDLHHLPFSDNTFDSILSVAVLEHTRFVWVVTQEFYRVLKPGGIAVVCIPFMQPRHGAPEDYVRFTDSGIRALMEWAKFNVLLVEGVHPLGHTVEWMLREVLSKHQITRRILWPLRYYAFPRLRQGWLLPREIENLRSAYYVVAEKAKSI